MRTAMERYGHWLREEIPKRHPEHEPAVRAAILAFDLIQNDQAINPDLLRPIVEAAWSERSFLCSFGANLLNELAENHEVAREEVLKMSEASRSQIRLNAIMRILNSAPLEFNLRLLRQGLRDKSASVRRFAADRALGLRLRTVVPDLEEAMMHEKNVKTKGEIEFALKLLRDGYILEPESDDRFSITAFCRKGIMSRGVPRTEFENRGIEAIVAEMAAK